MKKSFTWFVSFILVCSCISAYAADVSAFEAHSTIDLAPFKDEFYSADFDDMAYTATIKTPYLDFVMESNTQSNLTQSFELSPRISMTAINGVENFYPELAFYTPVYTSLNSVRIVIGENRYLLSADTTYSSQYYCRGTIKIGKSLLKEIIYTDLPVKFCVADSTSYIHEFTSEEIEILKHYVNDLQKVGLLDSFSDDDVIIITKYN